MTKPVILAAGTKYVGIEEDDDPRIIHVYTICEEEPIPMSKGGRMRRLVKLGIAEPAGDDWPLIDDWKKVVRDADKD